PDSAASGFVGRSHRGKVRDSTVAASAPCRKALHQARVIESFLPRMAQPPAGPPESASRAAFRGSINCVKGSPMPLPSGRKFTIGVMALLLTGIGLAYSNCFGVGFYFDDKYGIAMNPAIRSLRNVPRFFVDPYAVWIEGTQADLRPALLITFAANY